MGSTVLIVEDDANTANLVGLYLKRDGHKVAHAPDGVTGLKLAREARPDLVVLDLMLPRLDGMEITRALREESSVPIVMLTARVDETDRLKGLDLGADDYVTKPFSPRELAARVRAVLRRTKREAQANGPVRMAYEEVEVDLRSRQVTVAAGSVPLTPTEFSLLEMFIHEPGRVFTRDQIIDRVFGYDFDGFDRTVDAHVSNLRRKIHKASAEERKYVHTVYGVGYRFGDA